MRNFWITFLGFFCFLSVSVYAQDKETLRSKSAVEWSFESDETFKSGFSFGVSPESEIVRLGMESPSFMSFKNDYFKGIYASYFDLRFLRIKNLVDASSGILIQSFNMLFGFGLLTRSFFKEDESLFSKLGFEYIRPDQKLVTHSSYWGARIELGYEHYMKSGFWLKEVRESVYTSFSYDYNNITTDHIINSPVHFDTVALNFGFNFEY